MLETLGHRLQRLRNQPVAKREPIKTLMRFTRAQIINNWFGLPFLVSHDLDVTLIVEKGHHATRGHYFFGVQEWDIELFAINFLRRDERFIDVGANLGIFSLIVAATTGARVTAVEPSPSSSRVLRLHVALNGLTDRITLIEACAGDVKDAAFIKNSVDMDNFVVLDSDASADDMVEVPMVRIDDVVDVSTPGLLKMDVEGFEMQALKGATNLLGSPALRAIIVEISNMSYRFGVAPEQIHDFIKSFGFLPVQYESATRTIRHVDPEEISGALENLIYVRDLGEAQRRLSTAPKRQMHSVEI